MKRRMFLHASAAAGMGLLSGCAPVVRSTQPRLSLIGHLGITAAADPASLLSIEEFRRGLREQNLIEGENVAIDQRWLEGRGHSWARTQTTELVALGASVIVAGGSLWRPAREVTDAVPIVMTGPGGNVEQLIAQGWAKSAARPGGSVTGLSVVPQQAFLKRLEMLVAVAPRVRRIAVVSNLERYGESDADMRASVVQMGLQALVLDVRSVEQLELAFEQARLWDADAIAGEGLTETKAPTETKALSATLAGLALKSGLPTVFFNGRGVEAGLLLFYGAAFPEGYQFRRSAWYVARIMAGTKPGDLPIEVPDQVRFTVNRKTLAALGLTLPPHIAMQVTDWID